MKIKDLIIPKTGYKTHVNEIINNFKKTINRDIPRRQEENLKKLASLFFNDVKIDKPIVANLDIGQGKSTLLLEFIKYIHEIDSTFSTVIVKRTLQEGRDFCIETGLKNKETERVIAEWCSDIRKELEDIYYGDIDDLKETGHAAVLPDEDAFIARLLRGFNYKDCMKWEDPKKVEKYIGKLPDYYRDYSPVLCMNCERICGAKLSRWSADKHPALVITHQRLFLSNDMDNIAESISGRKVLIIDEKIETKDIGDVLLEQWKTIFAKLESSNLDEEHKKELNQIDKHLGNLQYPSKSDGTIVRIDAFNTKYKFNSQIYAVLMEDYDNIKNIVAVEKFLNYGGTASRSWHKNDKEQFSYIRYINLENYTRHFEKTIILDATSARNGEILDEDYKKSNVVFLDGLNQTAQGKINLYYSSQRTAKSSLINSTNIKTDKEKKQYRNPRGDKQFYLLNVDLIAHEIQDIITATNEKTLIICYKLILDRFGNEFKFEDDLKKMIKILNIDTKLYSIRHFGASTTGVNDFREYKNIVFVGMLNKGKLYYTNKTIAIDSGNPNITTLSEYIIDCIQQIGRICVRQGEEANVYMLFEDSIAVGLTQELTKHFSLKKKMWMPKYFNGINNATFAKQKTCWFSVINELKKMNEGDTLSLNSLQDVLKSQFKSDTVYRQIENPHVENYMITNLITYNRTEKCFKKKIPKQK